MRQARRCETPWRCMWPVSPPSVAARGLEVPLGSVLQDNFLQRQLGHNTLEPLVLPFQVFQTPRLVALQASILPAPAVVGDIRNPCVLAGLMDRLAFAHQYVNLSELRDCLLRAILLVRHLSTPSSKLNTTTFTLQHSTRRRKSRSGQLRAVRSLLFSDADM